MAETPQKILLELEDGLILEGASFGALRPAAGELVFNTGMVGYQESLTDPSYRGQILVFTYPLIGNYGVPAEKLDQFGLGVFESDHIQVSAVVVSESSDYSHQSAAFSLNDWLARHHIPGVSGIDTRLLTKRLREQGTMLARVYTPGTAVDFYDPNKENLVAQVSIAAPQLLESGAKTVVLVDCGAKQSIIKSLLARGVTVLRVPWNYDFSDENFDGIIISNGPGDPSMVEATVSVLNRAMEKRKPIFGICLGHQLLALAAGAKTYKLKFGHRSQNQPALRQEDSRCYMTSQNHGFAVDVRTLPQDWKPWFTNINDGTNEGIRSSRFPFMSVQFHPEAVPGPVDTNFLFDHFIELL